MINFFIRFLSSIFLLPIFIYLVYLGDYYLILLILIIFLTSIYEILNNVDDKFLKFILILILLIFSFCFFDIRGDDYEGFIKSIWIFSIVWLSDIGGYIFGKLIGGKKLSIYSPKKTIAGFIGSLTISQFAIFIPVIYFINFKIDIKYFLIQTFLSVVSVFGDIFFSYIKRKNNVKDFSNIIPGHGGILDRIDGLIFVLIIFYVINHLNVF